MFLPGAKLPAIEAADASRELKWWAVLRNVLCFSWQERHLLSPTYVTANRRNRTQINTDYLLRLISAAAFTNCLTPEMTTNSSAPYGFPASSIFARLVSRHSRGGGMPSFK